MRTSCDVFACVECGSIMEQVRDVPVLQSLQGHLILRCGACGHILLVQEERAEDWSAGWLAPLFMDQRPPITCVMMV
jgi:DNA-directed RNA polymerase subunit RPC12/RpoP